MKWLDDALGHNTGNIFCLFKFPVLIHTIMFHRAKRFRKKKKMTAGGYDGSHTKMVEPLYLVH